MKKHSIKQWIQVAGLLCLMLIVAAIPGKKADAATLVPNKATGYIKASTKGEKHTLRMKKDGYVTIAVKSGYEGNAYLSAGYISLYKGSKRISDPRYINYDVASDNQTRIYALKKGTYQVYVKLNYATVNTIEGYQPNQYQVATILKYASDQGGTKKSKATTLKLKKSKQGIIAQTDPAGGYNSSKGDWYKFKLTKKTKVRLYLTGYGQARPYLYTSGKISYKYRNNLNKFVQLKSTTLPKGTYYIRLSKLTKDGSFFYKIGLNKKVKL